MDTAISTHATLSTHPSISPAELVKMIGHCDAPLILDVRREAKFIESPRIVCGALRCTPEQVEAFARSHSPREVVVYCVYGHNVSEDAVAQLNQTGWSARLLSGGIEGGKEGSDADADTVANIAAWRAQALPTILKRTDWGVTGAPVSHEGDLYSFDALLKGFDLQNPALNILARIVRGADTDHLDLAPQSSGLLAISLGLSHLHATDDHAMLAAAIPLYDALYAWCIGKACAQGEAHSVQQQ
jgi:hypothetical protein